MFDAPVLRVGAGVRASRTQAFDALRLPRVQEEYVVRGERRKCPYAGRVFPVTLRFPNNYPFKVRARHYVRSASAPCPQLLLANPAAPRLR